MSDGLVRANSVSDEQIQAWADEAERGYDLTKLAPPLLGRSLVGNSPGAAAITVRSDGQPIDALTQRATPEEE